MNDRTLFPGADGMHNFYSRGGNSNPGTVVPGMNAMAPNVKGAQEKTPVPVVGFLYSISRQGFGEFWPLHIGSNKIGRSQDNDVCLREATVSDFHASLNIKQLKSTKKILASIKDEGSKNGIFVNDEELDYQSHEVNNHDLITIGDNYTLLLILIDAEEHGLKISENFHPVDPVTQGPQFSRENDTSMDHLYNSANRVENGTVAMDGSGDPDFGKTKFL